MGTNNRPVLQINEKYNKVEWIRLQTASKFFTLCVYGRSNCKEISKTIWSQSPYKIGIEKLEGRYDQCIARMSTKKYDFL